MKSEHCQRSKGIHKGNHRVLQTKRVREGVDVEVVFVRQIVLLCQVVSVDGERQTGRTTPTHHPTPMTPTVPTPRSVTKGKTETMSTDQRGPVVTPGAPPGRPPYALPSGRDGTPICSRKLPGTRGSVHRPAAHSIDTFLGRHR